MIWTKVYCAEDDATVDVAFVEMPNIGHTVEVRGMLREIVHIRWWNQEDMMYPEITVKP